MTTDTEFLTFLKFYKKMFYFNEEYNLSTLLKLGTSRIEKRELKGLLKILRRASRNGFNPETRETIERLTEYTKEVCEDSYKCNSHGEYRKLYSAFAQVYINLKPHVQLNGRSMVARELLSSIYDSDSKRQMLLYRLAESEK